MTKNNYINTSNKLTVIKDNLIEIQELIYVLKMALDNMEQPICDTTPYASLAKVIERKIACIVEDI